MRANHVLLAVALLAAPLAGCLDEESPGTTPPGDDIGPDSSNGGPSGTGNETRDNSTGVATDPVAAFTNGTTTLSAGAAANAFRAGTTIPDVAFADGVVAVVLELRWTAASPASSTLMLAAQDGSGASVASVSGASPLKLVLMKIDHDLGAIMPDVFADTATAGAAANQEWEFVATVFETEPADAYTAFRE